MQKSTHQFVKMCASRLPIIGPIYEFGALDVHDGDREEDLRYLFEPKGFDYVGCDMRDGPGVDQVQNLHNLDIEDGSVGTIVCMDTLEHVEFPRKALEEIHRVLKPDGIAIMSSVFAFPIHGYPNDYWRFTPNGFKSLFKDFASCRIYSHGASELNPQIVAGVGFKNSPPDIEGFEEACQKWAAWSSAIAAKIAADEKAK